jgi:hypothetical protein
MSKRTRTAHCRLTPFGEAVLTFPYSPDLIDALKTSIPYQFRSYNPADKSWMVESAYADLAIEILREHYPDAETPRRARKTINTEARPSGRDPFAVLHLRPTAPVELIEASYRVLARLHHPDCGGSHEAMQAVNGAYAALRERVSA